MTEPVRLARNTPVVDAADLLEIGPLVARSDEDLLVAMRRSSVQPATRLIGVVDDAGRLVGVLPILRLAEAVVARVAPESLLADISGVADVARFGHAVEARTVADAMVEPASIKPDATIGEAFRVMHQRRLSGLYVVDSDGRPTGYLDLIELAIAYLDAIEADQRATDAPAS